MSRAVVTSPTLPICKVCEKPFWSLAMSKVRKYCSPTCVSRAKNKRYLLKKESKVILSE